jgi:hypothetical protein
MMRIAIMPAWGEDHRVRVNLGHVVSYRPDSRGGTQIETTEGLLAERVDLTPEEMDALMERAGATIMVPWL